MTCKSDDSNLLMSLR